MSKSLPQRRLSSDEFLAWAQTQDEGRFELHDGRIVAMSPERAEHVEVKQNVFVALREAVRAANLPCFAYVDGLAVRINATGYNDLGPKVEGYFQVPSIRHYLVVDPDRRRIIHHRRGSGEALEILLVASGPVQLDPPGLEITAEDVFAGLAERLSAALN